jgi:sigma-E factor negative regulatory protein RseA
MNNENLSMTSDVGMRERERISALVDGQLTGEEFARTVAAMQGRADLTEAWRTYHLTGELLRAAQPVVSVDSSAFVSRLRGRLQAQEPVPQPAGASSQDGPQVLRGPAANDGQFRWKMVAGLASLAAVLAVTWGLVERSAQSGEQLAGAAAAVPQLAAAADPQTPGVMIRDARLDELLAAHKQFGSTSALQTPAGFLRNATLETTSSGR